MDYATPVGVFITDKELVIESWDEAIAQMTQISAERAIHSTLDALVPDLAERGVMARIQSALSDGNAQVLSATFHHYLIPCPPSVPSVSFDLMQQFVTISPLVNDGSQIEQLVFTIKDVTARLEWENEQKRKLSQGDELERLAATEALAQDQEGGTTDLLLSALDDDSWRVRRSASEGLAQRPPDETISALLQILRRQHRNATTLNSVIQTLVMADERVLAPLINMMTDPDPEVRTYVALTLGERRDAQAAEALIEALQDEDANVRFHTIEALGRIRAAQAVPELLDIASSDDFFLAFPALDALILIGDTSVAPQLTDLLENEMMRSLVVDALGHLGTHDIVPALAEQLNRGRVPAQVVAAALTDLFERYNNTFNEGTFISDLARSHIEPSGIQALMQSLETSQASDLRPLVIVLGWLGDREVSKALTRLLGTDVVRGEVVEALVRHGRGVADLLIEQLETPDLVVRKEAATALGRIGASEAVPALCASLGIDESLTVTCVAALAQIGDSRAFESLLGLLGHPSARVRHAAIATLNSLGMAELADHMTVLLNDEDPLIRESAVRIAGYFGYETCLDDLLARYNDPEAQVRRALVEHLPYLEHEDAAAIIQTATRDTSPGVRGASMRSLGVMPAAYALPSLLAGLEDEDPWVRYYAARSLGDIGSPESVEHLILAVQKDTVSFVRLAAIESLGGISGPKIIAVLAGLMNEPDLEIRRSAIQTLGRISHPDALPPLLGTLRNTDPDQRREVVLAVGMHSGREAVSALQWAATVDPVTAVRETAVSSLGSMGTHGAVSALVDLCIEPTCRDLAVAALCAQPPAATIWVASGLSHPQVEVRIATVEALARMKRSSATDRLRQALQDADARVRLAAVSALSQLGSWAAERDLAALVHTDPDPAVRRAILKMLRG
jgi:HEAT repeat protein